jgi:catechol 2,3-dioxygenase-like lactoylglutathione lyase family enzyme
VLALALSVPAPGGVAPGGAGMTQLDWQFAATELQDIMQLVTVEVTGVDGVGEGVTVGGVVTACAIRISPSARARGPPKQRVAAATRSTRLRMNASRLDTRILPRRRTIRHGECKRLVASTRRRHNRGAWRTLQPPKLRVYARFALRTRGAYLRANAMLDHVSLGVTDIDRSRRFYDAALRPLGLVRIVDFGEGRGSDYGASPGSTGVEFTITREAEVRTPIPGAHICFRAPDRAAVDAFHAAALACGGRDDGAPGLRPHYHADYYGAFVLDPDGHRVEAVCHAPTRPAIVVTG